MANSKSTASAVRSTATARDAGLARFQSFVLLLVGTGIFVTGIASEFVARSPALMAWLVTHDAHGHLQSTWTSWLLFFVIFGMVASVGARVRGNMRVGTGLVLFYACAALFGAILGPAISLYTTASVVRIACFTAVVFGLSALWGVTTKKSLAGVGSFCLMGLVALIVLMVAQIWILQSPALQLVIDFVGIIIFIGLTAWDMKTIELMYAEDGATMANAVNAALALYLDYLNLFLFFLQLGGDNK